MPAEEIVNDISGYLSDISSAEYGRTVRDSIVLAISSCYTKVSSGKLICDDAADTANAAAAAARQAAEGALAAQTQYNLARQAFTNMSTVVADFNDGVQAVTNSIESRGASYLNSTTAQAEAAVQARTLAELAAYGTIKSPEWSIAPINGSPITSNNWSSQSQISTGTMTLIGDYDVQVERRQETFQVTTLGALQYAAQAAGSATNAAGSVTQAQVLLADITEVRSNALSAASAAASFAYGSNRDGQWTVTTQDGQIISSTDPIANGQQFITETGMIAEITDGQITMLGAKQYAEQARADKESANSYASSAHDAVAAAQILKEQIETYYDSLLNTYHIATFIDDLADIVYFKNHFKDPSTEISSEDAELAGGYYYDTTLAAYHGAVTAKGLAEVASSSAVASASAASVSELNASAYSDTATQQATTVSNIYNSLINDYDIISLGTRITEFDEFKNEFYDSNHPDDGYLAEIRLARSSVVEYADIADAAKDEALSARTAAEAAQTSAEQANTLAQAWASSANEAMVAVDEDRETILNYYNSLVNTYNIGTLGDRITSLEGFRDRVEDSSDGYDVKFSNIQSYVIGAYDDISTWKDDLVLIHGQVSVMQESVLSKYDAIQQWYDYLSSREYQDITEQASYLSEQIDTITANISAIESDISHLNIEYIEDSIAEMESLRDDAIAAKEANEEEIAGLSEAISDARYAATQATTSADAAMTAAASVNTIVSNWSNVFYPQFENAITSLDNYSTMSRQALDDANTAEVQFDSMYTVASGFAEEWSSMKASMQSELASAANAITGLEDAMQSVVDMTVTSEPVNYNISGSASISVVEGHKNIHFMMQKGDPGANNIVKGSVYASLSALEADITDPEVGDQYNVGTSTPYNIYRWTGESWEDQGAFGVSIDIISNSDVDQIYTGNAVTSGDKYLNMPGLAYYTNTKLQPILDSKVNKVTGKGLSTNDFTDAYKLEVDTLRVDLTNLDSSKVTKIQGMGLSTYDFNSYYRDRITTNYTAITNLGTSKLGVDFENLTVVPSNTDITNAIIAIRNGNTTYGITGSNFINSLTGTSGILGTDRIATYAEATTYLGL